MSLILNLAVCIIFILFSAAAKSPQESHAPIQPSLIRQYNFRPSEQSSNYQIKLSSDSKPSYDQEYQLFVQLSDTKAPTEVLQSISVQAQVIDPQLYFADMNFDGFTDMVINIFDCRSYCPSQVYLWDSQKKLFNEKPVLIESKCKLHPRQKLIEQEGGGGIEFWSGFYRITDGQLIFKGDVRMICLPPETISIRVKDSEGNTLYEEERVSSDKDFQWFEKYREIAFNHAAQG